MYAIVEIAGQQFKVEKDQKIFVHRLNDTEGNNVEVGSKVTFDKVLLTDNDGKVSIGAPAIEGVSVTAKVIEHLKGDKVIVFKKKRRKGYKKKNGHRQYLTKIEITDILSGKSGGSTAKKTSAKKAQKSETAANDDLTKIEGVGPKIAEALNNGGVDSFGKLASMSVEEIKAVLEQAGGRVASKNPATWAQQAKLAAEGKWDELKILQGELDGGLEK